MDAKRVIEALGLIPHPEGGFYKETYRSDEPFPGQSLPSRYTGDRVFSTAIYYLLTADDFSALHRVASDEMFHFYLGDPVNLTIISPEGDLTHVTIGTDFHRGQRPQAQVPRGHWQGLKLEPGGQLALLGATVSPGFDFADFEMGSRDQLLEAFPHLSRHILSITQESGGNSSGERLVLNGR